MRTVMVLAGQRVAHARRFMHRFTGGVALHVVVGLAACAAPEPSPSPERLVVVIPVGNEAPALYGVVHNRGAAPRTLVGVDVALARRAALFTRREHLVATDELTDGMAGNRLPVSQVPIGAGESVRLAPDGLHALLYGLDRVLVPGDSTVVTLRFARGDPLTAPARVVAYAELDRILAIAPVGDASRPSAGPAGEGDVAAAASAEAGRALYRANGCASCHGPNGWGDGTVGRTLTPPPRDFRDADAFKNGTDVASIAQTIATGLMAGGAMPRYPHLTTPERESLALYVISLRTLSDSTTP
jgi:copper(I)-binding protein/cytochrome c551/c552